MSIVHQLEKIGRRYTKQGGKLEQLNQSMIDRDKMKDDAIAHLSDQLTPLSARL